VRNHAATDDAESESFHPRRFLLKREPVYLCREQAAYNPEREISTKSALRLRSFLVAGKHKEMPGVSTDFADSHRFQEGRFEVPSSAVLMSSTADGSTSELIILNLRQSVKSVDLFSPSCMKTK
ncbi:MAG: hypothetical protein Q8K78_12315, partial [Planctomycetaceae bacterium]|nr:hypothetical protein [Planctomycetaceae bacterium]